MNNSDKDELQPEYDIEKLGKGVRGKYFERNEQAINVVLIEPELFQAFPSAKAVNDALREVLKHRTGAN
jgi:hypothetical protein